MPEYIVRLRSGHTTRVRANSEQEAKQIVRSRIESIASHAKTREAQGSFKHRGQVQSIHEAD